MTQRKKLYLCLLIFFISFSSLIILVVLEIMGHRVEHF